MRGIGLLKQPGNGAGSAVLLPDGSDYIALGAQRLVHVNPFLMWRKRIAPL
jgi:hypothetical protein